MIWILLAVSIALNIYVLFKLNGLKIYIDELELPPSFNIIGDKGLKYKYTNKGIVFYDKTGKHILIKGEEI